MTIQDIIGQIVAQLEVPGTSPAVPPTYIHGWKGWENLKADEILNDIVFLDLPVSDDFIGKAKFIEESYNLYLHFYTKSELDFTPDQHLPLIARMRIQRQRFINNLRDSGLIKEIKSMRTIDVVNALDVNMTGVIVSLTVVPLKMNPIC